jgi:hypothetical protein
LLQSADPRLEHAELMPTATNNNHAMLANNALLTAFVNERKRSDAASFWLFAVVISRTWLVDTPNPDPDWVLFWYVVSSAIVLRWLYLHYYINNRAWKLEVDALRAAHTPAAAAAAAAAGGARVVALPAGPDALNQSNGV